MGSRNRGIEKERERERERWRDGESDLENKREGQKVESNTQCEHI